MSSQVVDDEPGNVMDIAMATIRHHNMPVLRVGRLRYVLDKKDNVTILVGYGNSRPEKMGSLHNIIKFRVTEHGVSCFGVLSAMKDYAVKHTRVSKFNVKVLDTTIPARDSAKGKDTLLFLRKHYIDHVQEAIDAFRKRYHKVKGFRLREGGRLSKTRWLNEESDSDSDLGIGLISQRMRNSESNSKKEKKQQQVKAKKAAKPKLKSKPKERKRTTVSEDEDIDTDAETDVEAVEAARKSKKKQPKKAKKAKGKEVGMSEGEDMDVDGDVDADDESEVEAETEAVVGAEATAAKDFDLKDFHREGSPGGLFLTPGPDDRSHPQTRGGQ